MTRRNRPGSTNLASTHTHVAWVPISNIVSLRHSLQCLLVRGRRHVPYICARQTCRSRCVVSVSHDTCISQKEIERCSFADKHSAWICAPPSVQRGTLRRPAAKRSTSQYMCDNIRPTSSAVRCFHSGARDHFPVHTQCVRLRGKLN